MTQAAYGILSDFDIGMLKLVYEKAGKMAMADEELCPATFEEGIRVMELAHEFVESLVSLSDDRASPSKMAAFSLRFMVWCQPFKNCNHRTGYTLCAQILEIFDLELMLSKDKIIEYVFSINRANRSEKEIEAWLNENSRSVLR